MIIMIIPNSFNLCAPIKIIFLFHFIFNIFLALFFVILFFWEGLLLVSLLSHMHALKNVCMYGEREDRRSSD